MCKINNKASSKHY